MEKWIFENGQSPGDIVMLTAAVRDLHRACPGRFLTDVRTPCPDLWTHNPHLTPLDPSAPEVRTLACHYPLIHESNSIPLHFIHGFTEFIGEKLGVRIRPTGFHGDIHLSPRERIRPPHLPARYWVLAAGGKYDFTIKWWHWRRWQEVIDRLRDKVTFVQVGQHGHYHPPLDGVIDLRGRTSLRDLIRLIHHAEGVLCPVTLPMHLAAAVPLPEGRRRLRACVVVAGGREPAHWEQYPGHRFLHTIGSLDCCARGGCWRARTVPLGDGSPLDHPDAICLDVTPAGLPRCMDSISAKMVAHTLLHAIEAAPHAGSQPDSAPRT